MKPPATFTSPIPPRMTLRSLISFALLLPATLLLAQGTVVQDGVYIYKLRYRALSDVGVNAEERIGHVTVIR